MCRIKNTNTKGMIMKERKKSLERKNDNNGNVNNDKLYLID